MSDCSAGLIFVVLCSRLRRFLCLLHCEAHNFDPPRGITALTSWLLGAGSAHAPDSNLSDVGFHQCLLRDPAFCTDGRAESR
ncbi:hypothetical protein BD414DRAFT_499792 [Trametes punicea]|nr:hypothetical protein BD414DRAFT_499792 [Trametes punicea]